jgi:hypothetical protein
MWRIVLSMKKQWLGVSYERKRQGDAAGGRSGGLLEGL